VTDASASGSREAARPTTGELWRVFGRIGLLSFGGPAAQIALMHRELVERRPWLDEDRFLSALSFCMLLPGPEAMQLATYAGWRLRGVAGGLIAGSLFVLPGAAVIFALAAIYVSYGQLPLVQAAFLGVQATVVVVVVEALLKVARRALKATDRWVVAGLAFIAIYAFGLPFPLIIGAAALYGGFTARGEAEPAPAPVSWQATARTVAVWLSLWLVPLAALWASGADRLFEIGRFFAGLAVVTFGGAYAVLAWMTQAAVETQGWLTTEQMIDALGLAETTPGPLILVTQFVGFLAGLPGGWASAFAAGLVTLHATFVPCFLWIFAGAPYLDWIASRPRLRGALDAITAAVVGVILNLSLWFGLHVLFGTVVEPAMGPLSPALPVPATLDPAALALTILAAGLLLWARLPLPGVLAACAAAGLALAAL
jgi:chromate transporter